MIRRPPRSTLDRSSAASDVYKRQEEDGERGQDGTGQGGDGLQRLVVDQFDVVDASQPVSYTHLRAHETVLDLVCRLLLEKKKKNHTQSLAS